MSPDSELHTDLDFIKDSDLKTTIEDSLQYIALLQLEIENSSSALFQEETYRVIVLYVIAIIEALLLYVLKQWGEKITVTEYKHIQSLDSGYVHTEKEGNVVVAVQVVKTKDYNRIGLTELVTFFEKQGRMRPHVAEEIRELNEIRNTFHFTKPRDKITCEVETAERALAALVSILQRTPIVISKPIKKTQK